MIEPEGEILFDVELVLFKETPNTFRYAEVEGEEGEEFKIGSLYVRKKVLSVGPPPKRLIARVIVPE